MDLNPGGPKKSDPEHIFHQGLACSEWNKNTFGRRRPWSGSPGGSERSVPASSKKSYPTKPAVDPPSPASSYSRRLKCSIHLFVKSAHVWDFRPEPVFVNVLRSPEVDSHPAGPVRQPYLTYRTARIHRLVESIPWNWFLCSLNVSTFGLWRAGTTYRVVVPAHQAGNRFLGSWKGLQIRALVFTPAKPISVGDLGTGQKNYSC